MIDTLEAGAGSYPEAPEDKRKCFEVLFIPKPMKCTIYADNLEEALDLVGNDEEWDDLNIEVHVEEILEIKEVND